MPRIALVTGFDQGLGAAFSRMLRNCHYEIRGLSVNALRQANGHAAPIKTLLDEELHGERVDVVVNNFGINHLSWIGETPADDGQIMSLNVNTPYWVVDYLAQRQKDERTHVVNIASQTHRVPQRCTALYCASKAAIVQMTRVMARELAPRWQVNCLSPGKVLGTKMTELTDKQVVELRGWDPDWADSYAESLVPMQRFTTPDEVGMSLLSLLDMPPYVTGINLEVMGGV